MRITHADQDHRGTAVETEGLTRRFGYQIRPGVIHAPQSPAGRVVEPRSLLVLTRSGYPGPLAGAGPNAATPAPRTDSLGVRWDSAAVHEMTLMSFEGGTEMTASTATERRELAQRSNHGIEVTVFWTESTNLVTIGVIDSHSAYELEFEVDGSAALDAFNHPFAYAATHRVRSAQAPRLVATG